MTQTQPLKRVHLVGAGPGDPGLLTMRGLEYLQQADVVIHDRLVNPLLLSYAPHAKWIDVGKQPDHHPVPQSQINALLVEHALQGKSVVRLKGGDPYVFGRGGEEALALAEAGIPFDIVPGITSAIAVPAYAGIPITHRGISQSVSFITGHSSKEDHLPDEWLCLASSGGTLVFLMGVVNLPGIVSQMLKGGRNPETPVALIEQGTCSNQRTVTGTLADIVERAQGIRPPAIVVVGEVVRLRESLRWFDQPDCSPLLGLRIINTRPLIPERALRNGTPGLNSQNLIGLDEFSYKLLLLGADSIHLPVMRLIPPADPLPLIDTIHRLSGKTAQDPPYDWILFTSANAVHFFMEQVFSLGYDTRIFGTIRIGALGNPTARSLAGYSLRADVQPAESTGVAMAGAIDSPEGKRFLIPHSKDALPGLGMALLKAGAQVDEVTAYELQSIDPPAPAFQSLTSGNIDLVTFFSPSAITHLARAIQKLYPGKDLSSTLTGIPVACIGPTTAQAAENSGLTVTIQAKQASVDGMIEAIIEWKSTLIHE